MEEALTDCFYKKIFDYLITQEKIGTINIKADNIGLMGTLPSGNGLNIINITPEAINTESLEHEMIHMLQIRFQTKTLTKNADGGMMEFERHLLRDLYKYIQIKGDWKGSYNPNAIGWSCWDGNSAKGSLYEMDKKINSERDLFTCDY